MESLKVILAFLSLATAVFLWWVKNNAEKKAKIKEKDNEIDKANDARSIFRLFDRMRK